jgi:RNA-directed DNA polymerase
VKTVIGTVKLRVAMRQLMENATLHGVSDEWNTIPWRKLERYVYRLQKRIYKAKQRSDTRAVRGLKRMLIRSKAAKTLAVRQVTQDNRGKRTAGIDGVKSLNPTERLAMTTTLSLNGKASPVRRVWIPKPGKTEKRPLGIPICLAYCISLSNGFGNGRRLDPRRGSRRELSIGE